MNNVGVLSVAETEAKVMCNSTTNTHLGISVLQWYCNAILELIKMSSRITL